MPQRYFLVSFTEFWTLKFLKFYRLILIQGLGNNACLPLLCQGAKFPCSTEHHIFAVTFLLCKK